MWQVSLQSWRRARATEVDIGGVVEAAGRYPGLHENQERNKRELQEAIEYMNAKQSRLMATIERTQTFDERSSLGNSQESSSRKSWSWRRSSPRSTVKCGVKVVVKVKPEE